ncbi:hypothetical protein [Occallatibacter savannae]|uniref:hypothetical protein n=1 Tax=Occallatibacter savannae TaxID=1002691 RepID=UPI0013A560BC|nr:hypothetical protein [Occallatibacter savannae]
MKLTELLSLRGIDPSKYKIRVVRHEDKRVDVHNFTRKELEIYQSFRATGHTWSLAAICEKRSRWKQKAEGSAGTTPQS